MKITKAVVLSAILSSSVAGAMYEGANEKTYNPSRLTTLSTIVLAKNPEVIPDNFTLAGDTCLNNVTEILRDSNMHFFQKQKTVAILKKITPTNESRSQIDSVGKALTEMSKEIKDFKKRVDKKEVTPDQADYAELQLLYSEGRLPMYRLVDGLIYNAVINKFDSSLAQFVRKNCGNDIISKNVDMFMVAAIERSTEPLKAITFLLENGCTVSNEMLDLAKKKYLEEKNKYGHVCSSLKYYENKKSKRYKQMISFPYYCPKYDIIKYDTMEYLLKKGLSKNIIEKLFYKHKDDHEEASKKKIKAHNRKVEMKKVTELLEKAKQEEIYSDVRTLF